MRPLLASIIAGVTTLLAIPSYAASGSFSTLGYNVAGIPFEYTGANATLHTPIISCYVKPYTIVNVQEDFNWHADLYNDCDNHLYRTPTSGGIGFGDGLNTLSNFAWDDLDRVTWSSRSGADALTPKGFSMVRMRLATGVYLDVYNLHAQAGTSSAELAASVSDVNQMLGYIESNSAGNAVMVVGDTNTRYTRQGQNFWAFLNHGFTDVWIQKIRNGQVPAIGNPLLCGTPQVASPTCEITDKALYRDNGFVGLVASNYVDHGDAVDNAGTQLSDHHPIEVDWRYATPSNRALSDQFGGPHGTSYNDVSQLPPNPSVSTVTIQTGSRVDHVEIALSNGYVFSHGGTGGNAQTLVLGAAEYLNAVNLCSGQYQGHTRIFSIALSTSAGRTLSGGTSTASCTTYSAAAGWQIVGFHGRSADEIDKLGVVYAPVATGVPAGRQPLRFINAGTGRCLDVNGGTMANGTSVDQWYCNGGSNQLWSYDDSTGMVRSMSDPHYCLDNGGNYGDGANLMIWSCSGNNNQRFKFDPSSGLLTLRSLATEVVDGGAAAGATAQTLAPNGSNTQRWTLTQ